MEITSNAAQLPDVETGEDGRYAKFVVEALERGWAAATIRRATGDFLANL